MFDKEWEQNIRNLRKPDKFYHKIDISKQYEQFCSERDTQKFWHQARLKVIPTKQFLHKIKCENTDIYIFDKKEETNRHFIKECKAYDNIWNKKYPRRNNKNTINEDLEEILNEDKPPPEKKAVAECIKASYKIRNLKHKKIKITKGI